MRPLAPLCLVLLVACPSSDVKPPGGPSISGQVVDIETCFTTAGCQGVAGLRVAFFHDTRTVSEVTHPNGGYTLTNVPVGVRDYALVSDAGSGDYLSVLQTVQLGSTGADVYGVELYAMKRSGGLFAAIAQQAGVSIDTAPLYFGVAAAVESGGMSAVGWATVSATPATAKVRYVSCTPAVKTPPCPAPLFDTSRTGTGPLGEFLIVAESKTILSVQVTATTASFEAVQAPVSAGYLTIGVHKGTLKPDGGVPKVDLRRGG